MSIKNGEAGKKYHFSSKEILSIKEILKKICRIKKKRFDSYVKLTKERKKKDEIYNLVSKQTQKSLKWNNSFDFESGLKKTIKFYKKNFIYLKNEKTEYKFRK